MRIGYPPARGERREDPAMDVRPPGRRGAAADISVADVSVADIVFGGHRVLLRLGSGERGEEELTAVRRFMIQ
jgi:hypothetical protein